jgi:hypothetical protein
MYSKYRKHWVPGDFKIYTCTYNKYRKHWVPGDFIHVRIVNTENTGYQETLYMYV